MVAPPLVKYLLHTCQYQVTLMDQEGSKAADIIQNHPRGKPVTWHHSQKEILDQQVSQSHLVVSLLPPSIHPQVARCCLKNKRSMVTTSYISDPIRNMHQQAVDRGILILNEIGEDPGQDHMKTKQMIDQIRFEGAKILQIQSYGSGLPAEGPEVNPWGYKFSWRPIGLISAVQTPAVYLENGQVIRINGNRLFDRPQRISIGGVGDFEAYPNRDCLPYIEPYQLEDGVSLYRGLLRYPGWCSTFKKLGLLKLLDPETRYSFENKTYREFTLGLINHQKNLRLEDDPAFLEKIKWLGLLEDSPILMTEGSAAELLIKRMTQKMSYRPQEADMTIIHIKMRIRTDQGTVMRCATMRCAQVGAMAKSVSLPAAIASRLIVEGKIQSKGVHIPTLKEIYEPVLKELENHGIQFREETYNLPSKELNY